MASAIVKKEMYNFHEKFYWFFQAFDKRLKGSFLWCLKVATPKGFFVVSKVKSLKCLGERWLQIMCSTYIVGYSKHKMLQKIEPDPLNLINGSDTTQKVTRIYIIRL